MNANDDRIVMTAEETAFIERFVKEHCTPHETVVARRLDRWCAEMQARIFESPIEWSLAAAGGILPAFEPKKKAPPPKSPNEMVRFVFASESDKPGKAWRAELSIPPEATVGTMLSVKVSGLGGLSALLLHTSARPLSRPCSARLLFRALLPLPCL